jgi:hypothetical protein
MKIHICDFVPEIRASVFRLLRYLVLSDKSTSISVWELHLDVLLNRAIVRANKSDVEKEQALKFIRIFLDLPNGLQQLPRSAISAILPITEQQDDKFRNAALQTLCELSKQQQLQGSSRSLLIDSCC